MAGKTLEALLHLIAEERREIEQLEKKLADRREVLATFERRAREQDESSATLIPARAPQTPAQTPRTSVVAQPAQSAPEPRNSASAHAAPSKRDPRQIEGWPERIDAFLGERTGQRFTVAHLVQLLPQLGYRFDEGGTDPDKIVGRALRRSGKRYGWQSEEDPTGGKAKLWFKPRRSEAFAGMKEVRRA